MNQVSGAFRNIALGVGALVVIGAIIGGHGHSSSSTQQPTGAEGSTYAAAAAAPAASVPPPSDFRIAVKILAKQCFGSAGCVLTYRIDPTYVGSPLSSDQALTVVYEVTGGQDGPVINNFTVSGNSARFPQQEVVQTVSSGTVLKATPTSVSQN
jgi:hypothetical protein